MGDQNPSTADCFQFADLIDFLSQYDAINVMCECAFTQFHEWIVQVFSIGFGCKYGCLFYWMIDVTVMNFLFKTKQTCSSVWFDLICFVSIPFVLFFVLPQKYSLAQKYRLAQKIS